VLDAMPPTRSVIDGFPRVLLDVAGECGNNVQGLAAIVRCGVGGTARVPLCPDRRRPTCREWLPAQRAGPAEAVTLREAGPHRRRRPAEVAPRPRAGGRRRRRATPIRASVGLVEVHRHDERTAEEILRDADRAMYAAKRGGRGDWCLERVRRGGRGPWPPRC
jgi:GGDEF domain-containing protein